MQECADPSWSIASFLRSWFSELFGKTIGRYLGVLSFATVALILSPRYLSADFNAAMANDPQKFIELIVVYYGLLSIPVAWSIFPSLLRVPKARGYIATAIFSVFLVSSRVVTYFGLGNPERLLDILVGAIILYVLREVVSTKEKAPLGSPTPAFLDFGQQFASGLVYFGTVTAAEVIILWSTRGMLPYPYLTAGIWASLALIFGLPILRVYARGFAEEGISIRSFFASMKSAKEMERLAVISNLSVIGVLLAHVTYASSVELHSIIYAIVLLGLPSTSSLPTLLVVALYALVFALLIAMAITPLWVNYRSLGMSEDDIRRIMESKTIWRTPLIIQDLLTALTFGLIKTDLFLVIPLTLFGVTPNRLLSFPNEAYILLVTIILLFFGRILTTLAGRSFPLYALGIVMAPISIVFSTSLDFFHTDIKRRLLRHYARLQEQLPLIIERLEKAATNEYDLLLLRLISRYGLLDQEIIGGKHGLPGIRPVDIDPVARVLNLSIRDRKSKKLAQISIPLDVETAHLLESCLSGVTPTNRIFQISRMQLWARIIHLAKRAAENPLQITTFRLRAHFVTYCSKNLPSDVAEQLRTRSVTNPSSPDTHIR